MPMSFYALVVAGTFLIIFFLYAMLGKQIKVDESYDDIFSNKANKNLDKSILDTRNFSRRQEMKRKTIHMLAILYLAIWVVQPLIFYGVAILYRGIENTATAENFFNANYLFEDKDIEVILRNGLITQFFMYLCVFWYNADAEIMRLRFKEYDYLFRKMVEATRRPTEVNDITASILLLLGLATSSIILTYGSADRIAGIYAQMAVICIAVLSDMFAALIGRKWGKHKWSFVKGKSIEGSVAGFLVGFISAMFFVGWFLALIGALIFVFTDIGLAKVNISDNASNPILLAIVFKILIGFVSPMIVILPFIKIW
jgi:dolichol kinase